MVEELLSDEKFRSRRFLGAVFVEGFASLVVVALGVSKILAMIFGWTSLVPLMPVLWWWSATSSGVLSIYGGGKLIDNIKDARGNS